MPINLLEVWEFEAGPCFVDFNTGRQYPFLKETTVAEALKIAKGIDPDALAVAGGFINGITWPLKDFPKALRGRPLKEAINALRKETERRFLTNEERRWLKEVNNSC